MTVPTLHQVGAAIEVALLLAAGLAIILCAAVALNEAWKRLRGHDLLDEPTPASQERATVVSLYSHRRRQVQAATKEAPASLRTIRGATHGETREHHTR